MLFLKYVHHVLCELVHLNPNVFQCCSNTFYYTYKHFNKYSTYNRLFLHSVSLTFYIFIGAYFLFHLCFQLRPLPSNLHLQLYKAYFTNDLDSLTPVIISALSDLPLNFFNSTKIFTIFI